MWKNYIVYDIAKKVRHRIRCRTSHRTYDWQEWGISPTMSYVFALIVRFDVRHRTFYVRHRTSHRIRYRTCDWQEWGNIVYDVGIFQRCRTSGCYVIYDVNKTVLHHTLIQRRIRILWTHSGACGSLSGTSQLCGPSMSQCCFALFDVNHCFKQDICANTRRRGIKWECDHFNRRPKAQCYPFNIDSHRFWDKNPQVSYSHRILCRIRYRIRHRIRHRIRYSCTQYHIQFWYWDTLLQTHNTASSPQSKNDTANLFWVYILHRFEYPAWQSTGLFSLAV